MTEVVAQRSLFALVFLSLLRLRLERPLDLTLHNFGGDLARFYEKPNLAVLDLDVNFLGELRMLLHRNLVDCDLAPEKLFEFEFLDLLHQLFEVPLFRRQNNRLRILPPAENAGRELCALGLAAGKALLICPGILFEHSHEHCDLIDHGLTAPHNPLLHCSNALVRFVLELRCPPNQRTDPLDRLRRLTVCPDGLSQRLHIRHVFDTALETRHKHPFLGGKR